MNFETVDGRIHHIRGEFWGMEAYLQNFLKCVLSRIHQKIIYEL
jgi:hypothetical protein